MTRISRITAIVVLAIVTGVRCLRDARLEVIPEIVERGSEATLRCHYVLENTPLYSLKWYRGKHEFYRYSPSETPNTKVFGVSGIQVDVTKSNESQVTIRNVEFEVAGNFSCEVTADAPSFSTEIGWKKLTVVSLPTGSPVITTERERYDPGDILRANCTALPSKPPAIIYFTLNNQPVGQPSSERMAHRQHKSDQHAKDVHQEEKRKHWEWDDLQWNEISLTLQSSHYVNGQLSLRCIVKIPDIYNATSEVQLGAGLREPVPERVTSENSAVMTSSLSSLTLLFLSLSYTLGR